MSRRCLPRLMALLGFLPRRMAPLAALGLAAMLGGCVVYPAYPGYVAYPARGYGYAGPYYDGGYYGGWRR